MVSRDPFIEVFVITAAVSLLLCPNDACVVAQRNLHKKDLRQTFTLVQFCLNSVTFSLWCFSLRIFKFLNVQTTFKAISAEVLWQFLSTLLIKCFVLASCLSHSWYFRANRSKQRVVASREKHSLLWEVTETFSKYSQTFRNIENERVQPSAFW